MLSAGQPVKDGRKLLNRPVRHPHVGNAELFAEPEQFLDDAVGRAHQYMRGPRQIGDTQRRPGIAAPDPVGDIT